MTKIEQAMVSDETLNNYLEVVSNDEFRKDIEELKSSYLAIIKSSHSAITEAIGFISTNLLERESKKLKKQ